MNVCFLIFYQPLALTVQPNNMKFIKFLITAGLSLVLIFILNTQGAFGNQRLPALGKWLDPFSGFWNNSSPEQNLHAELPAFDELEDHVEVLYDDRLVPHIFASNLNDLLFVQGYLEARHRLWQMDLMARAAAGRLSEVFGPSLLEYDQLQRRKGLAWSAEKAVTGWLTAGQERFPALVSYVDGINAYISQLDERNMPVEFKLLGYEPEPWSVLKSALVSKRMAQTLNYREIDLETTNTLQAIGPEMFEFCSRNTIQNKHRSSRMKLCRRSLLIPALRLPCQIVVCRDTSVRNHWLPNSWEVTTGRWLVPRLLPAIRSCVMILICS